MCQRVIQKPKALKLSFYRGTKHGLWQQSTRAAICLLPQLPLRRQIAIERIAAHTQSLADVGDGDRLFLHQSLSSLELVLRHDPRPASLAAPRPGGGSGLRPFPDKAPFILGQRSKHLKHQSSHRGLGVHLFRERDRLHALGLQNIDKAQQVVEVTPQGVEPPHHKHIVPAHLFTEPPQLRPVGTGYGSRAGIGEDALTAGLEQGVLLQGVGLFVSADTGIAKLHAGFLPKSF